MDPTLSFFDDDVPLGLLRQRAFNQRWAEQPDDVIPLTAADPDFGIAPVIRERLERHARDGVMSYGPPLGLPEFRDAVASWMHKTRGLDCSAGHVLATDGAASALVLAARASLTPGDEVLMPDPVDFLLRHAVERAGAIAVPVSITPGTSAADFIAAMEQRLSRQTRMLWLCNPHNPLGIVHSHDWLQTVVHWAINHGLRILCDEVWSDIVFTPHRHVSAAALSPEVAAHVVTVYGFSKNFALAGLRVGCLVCTDGEWFGRLAAASDAGSTVFGVSVLSQVAAVAGMEEGQPWLASFVRHLQAQRDHALRRMRRWPGVLTDEPQGTFVLFPDVHAIDDDAERLCLDIKQAARVALVPGTPRWFGQGASGHVRVCFATSRGMLDTAFDRLDGWLVGRAFRQVNQP